MFKKLVPLALLVGLALPASAQRTTGSISGTVKDATGAALPGVTEETMAPEGDFNPKSAKPSRGTAVTATPIRPRTTLPCRNCGSSSRTRLLGTANPIPMFPSFTAFVMIAVFMPITSPRAFNSGPPELPGLIAASV